MGLREENRSSEAFFDLSCGAFGLCVEMRENYFSNVHSICYRRF